MMGNFFVEYNIVYCAAVIVCGLLLVFMAIKMDRDVGNIVEIKAFRKMIVTEVLVIIVELCWMLGNLKIESFHIILSWLLNLLDLIGSVATLYFMMRFIEVKLIPRHNLAEHCNSLLDRLLIIPLLIDIVGNLLSLKTQAFFYIDAHNIYHRGPYYFIQVLCCYFYPIVTFIILIYWSFKDLLRRQRSIQLLIFLLFPFLGGLFQVFVGIAPFSIMSTMLGLFYLFSSMQSERINTDALTHLNNRNRCREYLAMRIKSAKDSPFYLIIGDINDFKQINDTYGHIRGDQALVIVASTFKNMGGLYHSFFASRYGGDEFLLTIDAKTMTPETFRKVFDRLLERNIQNNHLSFPLSLSLGFAYIDSSHVNLLDKLDEADDALYHEKARKKGH